jgi:hypothetical protein
VELELRDRLGDRKQRAARRVDPAAERRAGAWVAGRPRRRLEVALFFHLLGARLLLALEAPRVVASEPQVLVAAENRDVLAGK